MSAVVDRFDAGTQPAGRPGAPGRLAYAQAFLNTFWDLDGDGDEVWTSPAAYGAWLRARGFRGAPSGADLARAVAPSAALTPCLSTGALDPAGDGPDAACALVLAIVFAARADGTFRRLKACPHAHCGWAFYDSSRNRSGQWCSMRICGNRTKGETFRRRHAVPRA